MLFNMNAWIFLLILIVIIGVIGYACYLVGYVNGVTKGVLAEKTEWERQNGKTAV